MPRTLAASIFLCLSVALSSARADDPPAPNQNNTTTQGPLSAPKGINRFTKPEDMTEESRKEFNTFVAEGDRARLTSNPVDAITAYRNALDIYDDPLIAGRFGIVILMLDERQLDYIAASHLNEAIDHAAGVNQAERDLFWQAYSRLRRRVCEVLVNANDINAIVYTGPLRRPATGLNGFLSYVNAGANHFRATLAGHPDIDKTFTCVGGEKVWVDFVFEKQEEPPPELPLDTMERIIVRELPPIAPPILIPPKEERGRFSIGVGLVMVAGAAPSLSLGGTVSASYRRDNLSGMIGARGAWALGDVENAPIDIFVFSGFGGPCTHVRWFAACALASVNAFHHKVTLDDSRAEEINNQLIPGLGIGVTGDLPIKYNMHLRISGDITVLSRDIIIDNIRPERIAPIWHGGRFVAGVSTTVVF